MSETYGTFQRRVRNLINDVGGGNYAVSAARMQALTEMRMHELGPRLGYGEKWITPVVTLLAGTRDYTLTASGVEYGALSIVQRGSDRVPLKKRTADEFAALYSGNPLDTSTQVTDYTEWEGTDQTRRIRVGPVPSIGDTLEIFHSTIPDAIATEASTLPFSRPHLLVLTRAVALDCIAVIDQQHAARLRVDKQVIGAWLKSIEDATYWEEVRKSVTQRTESKRLVDV